MAITKLDSNLLGTDSTGTGKITSAGGSVSIDSSGNVRIANSSANSVIVNSSGDVGIGTTNPTPPSGYNGLHINATYPVLKLSATSSGSGATDGFALRIDSTPRVELWNYENTAMAFATNNAERMRIDSSGNVKIGTTSGGGKLNVTSDIQTSLQLENTTYTTKFAIDHPSGGSVDIQTYTGGAWTVPMSFKSGSVGVGVSSPAALLDVQNTSRTDTTSGVYVAGNGGIVDRARYEMISKCVTSFPSYNNKIMAQNGAPLWIDNARSTWSYYSSLPNYLIGSLTHDCINNTSFNFTLACTMTVFLMRNPGWNPVDLTGWTEIETGQSGNPASSYSLYVKTLSAGSYSLSNNSAMYFFLI